MGSNVYVSIHPDSREVRADIIRHGPRGLGYRCVDIGLVTIFIFDRPVLDALQAALDEIRADMDSVEVGDLAAVPQP